MYFMYIFLDHRQLKWILLLEFLAQFKPIKYSSIIKTKLKIATLNAHLITVIRPRTEFHEASLLIEWKISNIDFT